ncbi:hypothetical protein EON83_15715 [bacterium]|nr:MAG: hypothetical protein EON83_15715 [bacterium]
MKPNFHPLAPTARLHSLWLSLLLVFCCALMTAFAPSAHAQNTSFLSNTGDSLTDIDDYYYQSFSLNRTTTLDLRFASDYAADCVVLAPGYLNSFISGGTYRYYDGFDNRYGTRRFTLAPGNYYLAVRNEVYARNDFSCELDYALTSLAPDNNGTYSFGRWGISGSRYVPARGGVFYHAFNTTSTERTFLDGCNSGLETYIVAPGQLNNVLSGRTFSYYPAYSGSGAELPGLSEITLPVGTYYLVFINESNIPKAVTYQMEHWKRTNAVYLDLQAPASWTMSGNTVSINIAKILNTSSSITSGSLRLSLWALQAPYTGGSNSGVNMANVDLAYLRPGYQYTNLRPTLSATFPSGSTYYTAFILNEWTGSAWRVVDWVNMSNRTTFSTRSTRSIKQTETTSITAAGAPRPDASIVATPLPATRSTAAVSLRSTRAAVGSFSGDTTIAAPSTNSGVLNADSLIGQGRSRVKPRSSSPNPSASSS